MRLALALAKILPANKEETPLKRYPKRELPLYEANVPRVLRDGDRVLISWEQALMGNDPEFKAALARGDCEATQ